jgi:4-hydroxy-tetrahydrodipicolinate reductase
MNAIVARLLGEKGVEIVGAVGLSPKKVGRDAGEVLGLPHALGVEVVADAGALYDYVRPEIAMVATSSFRAVADQYDVLATSAHHGVNAITIGEELAVPVAHGPRAHR